MDLTEALSISMRIRFVQPTGVLVAVCLGLALAVPLAAQEPAGARPAVPGAPSSGASPVNPEKAPRPTARIQRTPGPIVVDGNLDDAAWAAAPPISGFVQSQPRAGYPASEPTVVRILYDDRRIYIGAECHDSEPLALVVSGLEQDYDSVNSDVFGVTFDTFYDRRNAYMFLVNPRGAIKDAQNVDDSRSENQAWEGVIELKTVVHGWGWSVELAIPFTTLRFDPSRDPQVWGMNFLRRIRRKNEDSLWAPLDRRDRVHRMSKAGTLTGLEGLRPGRNLMVKPFGLAGTSSGSQRPPSMSGTKLDGGLDVKYGVTPRLALDLTWRTDFSQVEVDQEQVNLTRFSLFFPEKRDFFMENSGSFQFGDVSDGSYRTGASLSDFALFHSRRIGLTASGQPIPILGGSRMTGRAGPFELGLLDMQTQATTGNPAENFAVLRVRRGIAGKADIGALFINRQVTGDNDGRYQAYNRSYGVDMNFRPLRALAINSYFAATDSPNQTGDNRAARVSAGWRDQFWDVSAFVKHVGDGFDPGVGFIRRRAMRHHYGTVGIRPRPKLRFVQEMNPYAEFDYITDVKSVLETRQLTLGFGTQFKDGGSLDVKANNNFERLYAPFTVAPGGVVPAGDYPFRDASIGYNSSAARRFSSRVSVARGGFYDGRKTTLSASVTLRPSYHLSTDFSINHNNIMLHGRSFAVDVFGARARWGLSTKFFASAFVQYNASSDQSVINLRMNYIHGPLSHFYVTYTERLNAGAPSGAASALLERVLTAKVTKLLSF